MGQGFIPGSSVKLDPAQTFQHLRTISGAVSIPFRNPFISEPHEDRRAAQILNPHRRFFHRCAVVGETPRRRWRRSWGRRRASSRARTCSPPPSATARSATSSTTAADPAEASLCPPRFSPALACLAVRARLQGGLIDSLLELVSGGSAGREDGDEDVPQRVHDSTM